MTKFMIAVVMGLFVMSLSSLSFAGMMDSLTGQADEAKQEASEAMENKETDAGKAIEAQDATKEESGGMMEESGGMMDQAKETAKDQAKEQIDTLGK